MIKRWIVAVIMAVSTTLVSADDVEGRLDWLNRVELGTTVSGKISRVEVQPGDRVRSGRLLAALDQRRYLARVTAAKAGLEAALHDKAEAAKELERTFDLFERDVLSEHNYKLAEIAASRAVADWRQANASLVEAQADLEECHITAPFGGVVVKVAAVVGATTVNRLQSESLVVLADDSAFLVHGGVTSEQAAGLAVGGDVEVSVRGNPYSGKILYIGLEPAAAGDYGLTVRMERPKTLQLRAGEAAVIRF